MFPDGWRSQSWRIGRPLAPSTARMPPAGDHRLATGKEPRERLSQAPRPSQCNDELETGTGSVRKKQAKHASRPGILGTSVYEPSRLSRHGPYAHARIDGPPQMNDATSGRLPAASHDPRPQNGADIRRTIAPVSPGKRLSPDRKRDSPWRLQVRTASPEYRYGPREGVA